jgi:hypothetical protein
MDSPSKKGEGKKVSSRLIARVLKKAQIPSSTRGLPIQELKVHLKEAHHLYFATRASAPELRVQHLDSVAAAWAEQGNSTKEKMLKQLKQRKQIKSSHWRIKFLHGKLEQAVLLW